MAYDSGPTPSGGLSAAVIDRVSNALADYLADSHTRGDELRAALRDMAIEARGSSMPPEKVLIALKDIWHELPVVRGPLERDERARLLQGVVTMCINEYYRD